MTEAGGPDERPRRRAVGEPGPSWAGDGDLPDEREAREAREAAVAPASTVAPASMVAAATRASEPGPLGLELASFGRRFVGFGIDNILVLVMLVIFNALLGLNAGSLTESETRVFSLVNILTQFFYWWVWNTIGWSPGKRAVGLRIVDAEGAAPGIDRGFRRTVMSLVSQLALFVGYLWALRDGRNQTWHDKAGGTFVVVVPAEDQRPL